jgi:hypothetical protein
LASHCTTADVDGQTSALAEPAEPNGLNLNRYSAW